MQMCGQVFMYAIATGRAERNPVPDLRGALKTPVVKHHAYLKAADLPEFLKQLEAYDGGLQTKLALRFLLLTFVRTTELRAAEWTEVDFDKAEWRIPAKRMKMKEEHIVPLSRQAVAVLRELQKHTGNRQHLFPNQHKPITFMSENTMLYALYRMGYHSRTTGHGFRSTASTILNENGFMPDVIERQLAHGERNKVRAAYNHAQYLPERRKMMQWWADYLDKVAAKKSREETMTFSPNRNHKANLPSSWPLPAFGAATLKNSMPVFTPVTRSGDYSDVKVIDAEGREIPWNQVSRINQDEMKTLMTGVVNRIHTFLARTLFSATEDKAFQQALDRAAIPWTKAWDEPEYLPEFLMPPSEKQS